MSTRITVVHRIIIAIAIEVQAVDGFGVQIGGIVRGDKPSPFGAIVPGVAIVQAGIMVEVLATGTNMGVFVTARSIYLFYHPLQPQSRKKPPRP